MIGDVRMENGGQVGANSAQRERLPQDRGGVVRKIKVGGAKVYVKTGEYADGRLGEIFLQLDEYGPVCGTVNDRKELVAAIAGLAEIERKIILEALGRRERLASALTEQVTDLSVSVSRLLDALATAVSIGLQYRIPLKVFCDKHEHTNFEPSGFTGDERIGRASSPLDAVFRYLRGRYVPVERENGVALVAAGDSQGGE